MMQHRTTAAGGLALVLALGAAAPMAAQPISGQFPLAPIPSHGDLVAPYFDGWWTNPDGTHTFSFGFFNRNREELVEIPVGENNFLTPAQFNGMQPETFPVVSYGGFSGRRERGAFGVTVPADFTGDVVWTIVHNGQTHTVPGRVGSVAYELSLTPQAVGSRRPLVQTREGGPAAFGPEGIVGDQAVTARVGEPVQLTVFAEDRGERDPRDMNVTWLKHQGPVGGVVTFEPRTERVGPVASQTVTAVFDTPGTWMVRARVDNFTSSDSSFADQCCWSNAFYRVTVNP